VEKDKKSTRPTALPAEKSNTGPSTSIDEFFRGLQPEMRHPKPSPDAVAAAIESAQRLAAEADTEQAADDVASALTDAIACPACGHRSRAGNRFCAMCGAMCGATSESAVEPKSAGSLSPPAPGIVEERHPAPNSGALETHHYHHHYHHHYFPAGADGVPRGADSARAENKSEGREDRMRPNLALRGDMSRAEAAVRHITHEWMLACNTKHLDDLLDLYAADAMVLRSNYPPVRGAAAVREFFFSLLDAGFGEVELEPLRLDVVGDLAYEAGRCKSLVPSAAGKRREERGKYLWVFSRQNGGDWKLSADCWSADLSLTTLESDIPAGSTVRTRKNG
jgi:ketosteroid isomerase-like protein